VLSERPGEPTDMTAALANPLWSTKSESVGLVSQFVCVCRVLAITLRTHTAHSQSRIYVMDALCRHPADGVTHRA
jgi:hypothetical protein